MLMEHRELLVFVIIALCIWGFMLGRMTMRDELRAEQREREQRERPL